MTVIVFLVNLAFFFVCLVVIAAVLIQPGKGGGLSALGGGLESALGTRANATMRNITIAFGIALFMFAVVLNRMEAGKYMGTVPKALREAASKSKVVPTQGHTDAEAPAPAPKADKKK